MSRTATYSFVRLKYAKPPCAKYNDRSEEMTDKPNARPKLPLPSPKAGSKNLAAPAPARRTRKSKTPTTIQEFQFTTNPTESGQEASIASRLEKNRTPLSSVLVSMILHSTLFILLAMTSYLWPSKPKGLTINAVIVDTPLLEEDEPKENTPKVQVELPKQIEFAPIEMEDTDIADDIEEETPLLSENTDMSDAKEVNPIPAETVPIASNANLPTGGGLAGRDADARAKRAGESGGSQASEDAVELGLKWLAAHQRLDGSWRLDLKNTPCKGRCQHSGSRESTSAATGLALLAFLGAGYTHETGPYQDEVNRGLLYLMGKIRVTKFGGSLAEPTMYSHAIATLAIGEAFALTGDTQLQNTLEAAMKYIIAAQHSAGGWRYNVQTPGDMTVTGWQIMALKSCELSGLTVPQEVWDSAGKFIKSKQANYGSTYGYLKPGAEHSPTAVGLLCQMYLGWGRDSLPLQDGSLQLAEWGPSRSNIYFDYYATLVLHHLRGKEWENWNETMRDYLVSTQDRRGHQTGSWHFQDKHGSVGGRLYTTAMAIMVLEVYYRYLPLYEEQSVQNKDSE
jgi:hypothetical protein